MATSLYTDAPSGTAGGAAGDDGTSSSHSSTTPGGGSSCWSSLLRCRALRDCVYERGSIRWLSLPAVCLLVFSSIAQYYSTSVLGLALYTALDYTPQQTTLFWVYMSWVYWFSPLVGWVSDWVAVAGQRRRPAMMLGIAMSCVTWTALWLGTENRIEYAAFVAIALAATLAQMFVTIPLNGIIVEAATAASEAAKQIADLDDGADNALLAAGVNNSSGGDLEGPLLVREDGASSSAGDRQGDEDDDEEARREQEAHRVVGEVQSAAMLWKTIGSLVGAVIQTVVQIKVASDRALAGAPVLFLVLVPMVVWLRHDPRTAGQQRYATMNPLQRVRELAKAICTACADVRVRHRQEVRGPTQQVATDRGDGLFGALRRLYRHPLVALWAVLAFVFVYNATPDASVMYSQYLADEFLFTEWFLSMNQGIGLIGSCLGCEVYARFIAKRDQFRVFAIGCVAAGLCYATRIMLATGFSTNTLHIEPKYFVPFDTFVVATLTRIAFMPVLHVASQRAPAGFEAFIFELFSVAAIGGSTVAGIVTARLSVSLGITSTAWSRFWILLTVCAASKVLPLIFSYFLPPPSTPNAAAVDDGEATGDPQRREDEGNETSREGRRSDDEESEVTMR